MFIPALVFFPPPDSKRTCLQGAQRIQMFSFLRIAAGDHATGHRAHTPLEVFSHRLRLCR